jgi:hypothetical protein
MKIELGPITSDVFNDADLLEVLVDYLRSLDLMSKTYDATICEARKAIETVRDGEATDWQDRDEIGNAYQVISELIEEVENHINEAETDNPFLVFGSFGDGNSTYGWQLNTSAVSDAFNSGKRLALSDGRVVSECGHVLSDGESGSRTLTTVDGAVISNWA